PMAPVLTVAEVSTAKHFRARGAIARADLAPGVEAEMPTGFIEINRRRVGPSRRAPTLGEHSEEIANEYSPFGVRPVVAAPSAEVTDGALRRPLEGVRVLDLGVIVMGAELAKLFADQGAEVIKIESHAFPDGAHVSPAHFAIGHRNARGLGLNLRSPRG